MPRSVFVSFVFEDKVYFERVKKWAEEGKLGAGTVVIGEIKDVRQDGDDAIRQHLKPRIEGSSAVLLLLGNDTHNHDWVKYELGVATSFRKSIVVARITGSVGAAPHGFAHLPVIALDPSAIQTALG